MNLQTLLAFLLFICTSVVTAGNEGHKIKTSSESKSGFHDILKASGLSSNQSVSSSLVYFGNDGRLVYKPYTDQGDKILDFSVCSYKRSEEPIPNVPVEISLTPLTGEVTPDGTMAYPKGPYSREYIQNALGIPTIRIFTLVCLD